VRRWTSDLHEHVASYDPNRCTCPDTPRYHALGNAVTVPVAECWGVAS
jgi:hypothetical protein